VNGTERLRAWVADLLGGEVVGWEPLVSGNSRTTWTADVQRGDERLAVVVRVDTGDGPFSHTPLTLAREAGVYGALQGTGVRIPYSYGYSRELDAVVVERAAGRPEWDERVLVALLGELARLHALDAEEIELPGGRGSALADFELWVGVGEERIAPRSPFVDFAVPFLRERAPAEPERLVVVHGDPGVGNLLWDGERITALLDWELTHVGDAHDDLAFLTVRSLLHELELPDFHQLVVEHYATPLGVALDQRRLLFWQAVGILRNLILCLASVSNPGGRRDRLVHHMLIPSLQRLLVGAMARLDGVELAAPESLGPPGTLPGADVLAEITRGFSSMVAGVSDPELAKQARRMRFLLRQFAETWPLAFEIARLDAAEPVASDPRERLAQLAAAADRGLALFPRAAPMGYAVPAGFT
jgi:aminoglycoside phosphotransferase (APT) family kinase protein